VIEVKTVFLTGVTGFLGSHWAMSLLRSGFKLILLARGKGNEPAELRVSNSLRLADFESHEIFKANYRIVDGDVTEENLGLSEDLIMELTTEVGIDEVHHVAGSIAFSEAMSSVNMNVNYFGTLKVLDFIEIVQPKKVCYAGTAFVCDENEPIAFEEYLNCDEQINRRFNNSYESSKCLAEKAVRQWIGKNSSITTMIFRPSIIVGHSRDGRISNFSGYYQYMKTFHTIKRVAQRYKDAFHGNGVLNLPIGVPGVRDAAINIVTIDYAIDLIMKLHKENFSGVYHVTNQNPPEYQWLLKKSLEVMEIVGPEITENRSSRVYGGNGSAKDKFIRSAESLIRKGLREYDPYISKNLAFSQDNVKRVLGSNFRDHPEIDADTVRILLEYAIACDFKVDPRVKTFKLVG